MANHILTREGYNGLKAEVSQLESELQELADELRDVKYHDEHNHEDPHIYNVQSQVDYVRERLNKLKNILDQAEVLDEDPDPNSASPGDIVHVQDMVTGEAMSFQLLDGVEIIQGRRGVALDSPVGKAMLGKRIGDVIVADIPDGVACYKITGFE